VPNFLSLSKEISGTLARKRTSFRKVFSGLRLELGIALNLYSGAVSGEFLLAEILYGKISIRAAQNSC